MTAQEFRTIALSMPEAIEGAHMGHPDFRVGGRIFATLSYPRRGFGMVKLTAEQQELFVNTRPKAFTPVPEKWGERGATHVRLPAAKREMYVKRSRSPGKITRLSRRPGGTSKLYFTMVVVFLRLAIAMSAMISSSAMMPIAIHTGCVYHSL